MKRCVALLFAVVAGLAAARARAASDVVVVEVSEADVSAADRLLELIAQPLPRMRLPEARDATLAFEALRTIGARRMVVLDSERERVQVFTLGDERVLTRDVERKPNADAPYVMAFVAYELLGLSAELDQDREAQPEPATELPARRAAVSGSLRLGAELATCCAPFSSMLRPTLGAGASFGLGPRSRFGLRVGLELALLGKADLSAAEGRIALTRSDARLRAGIGYAFDHRFSLSAFVRPRAALTAADYSGAGAVAAHRITLGIGAELELELRLVPWLALYAAPALDFATSRSEYRVLGVALGRDPARLFALALGVAFFEHFP